LLFDCLDGQLDGVTGRSTLLQVQKLAPDMLAMLIRKFSWPVNPVLGEHPFAEDCQMSNTFEGSPLHKRRRCDSEARSDTMRRPFVRKMDFREDLSKPNSLAQVTNQSRHGSGMSHSFDEQLV
jgi:hypothetical protein